MTMDLSFSKRLTALVVLGGFLLQPLTAFALEVRPEFNPNLLIADTTFSDTKTFGGPEGIQHFLESKGSVLANTSVDFLAKLNEPRDVALKLALDDPEPNLGRLRTAAELIWDVSQISGINPQVILVTLQKEQGLITTPVSQDRLPRALNHAMGFDCPDSSGCGNLFPGFYYQLFGNVDTEGNRYLGATKSLMKSFLTPNGRGPDVGRAPSHVGDSIQISNTLGDYAGISAQQMVTLGNRSTAALYRYTPHVFNGNYNFWNFFTSWFKYPNGTLLLSSQDRTLFIIQNGTRQRVPVFVATARHLNLANAITASPTELQGYPLGETYTPADNTIANANGQFYVFLDGVMHPASSFVLTQRNLNVATSIPLGMDEISLFSQGTQLTPADGTVVRGQQNPAVYLVSQGSLKLYSAFTFKQHDAGKKLQFIPDSEIALYPKHGYVLPLEGTLVQSASTPDIYLVSQERRLPLTKELFQNLGFQQKNVVRLTTDAELASIPIGPPATPHEGTYFSVTGSSEFYLFKNGAKHPIAAFVAKQRKITPDYAFEAGIISNWADGIALPPVDGTLVKSDSASTVYLVTKGQLRPLTDVLFKNLGLRAKDVVTMPDADVSALPKGDFATPKENTYFSVAETGDFYVFKNGVKQRIYPFVATQRGMTPDYTFSFSLVTNWPTGTPIAPREGTLLKSSNNATIYLFTQGKLSALSSAAFKRRGYSVKQIKTLSEAELATFPKGIAISK